MAIGPSKPQPNFEVSRMDRIQNATKRLITAYFENPLHYVFYITLIGMIVLIARFGRAPGQLWLVMGLLTACKIFNHLNEKTKEK